MKRLLSFILCCSAALSLAQAPATCSLDAGFMASNKKGIYPDSATNFVGGVAGMAYAQNITVKVPKDTVQGPVRICFNRIEVSTPSGYTNFNLPQGLSFSAGPTVTASAGSYKFPGNDNSCAVIYGTPAAAGIYTVQFRVTAYGTPVAASAACPATPNTTQGTAVTATNLSYYLIKISPSVGIREELPKSALRLGNSPNPFNQRTTIKFTVKDEAPAKLCVYGVLGNKIYEDRIAATSGDNSYELNTTGWNSGIYLYTLQYKNHTETRRMVLSNSN